MGSGEFVAAFEDAGINVLLAYDEDSLASCVGVLLERSGFLRFAQEVEIHRAAPPRAERLEPSQVWTQSEGVSPLQAGDTEPEEATTWS